jgi:ParB family chromosome partitioning protein
MIESCGKTAHAGALPEGEGAVPHRKPDHAVDGSDLTVAWVPIDPIRVPTPRLRDKKRHARITQNIFDVGLKRPITLRPRGDGGYDLVCGQGRLESLQCLGETLAPAIIRDISEKESLLMSLVENIARRTRTTMEMVRELALLRERGYTQVEIGQKVGMATNHVGEYLFLYDRGEAKLLSAVDTGSISITAALTIARTEDDQLRAALREALQEGKLTAAELQRACKLADVRRAFGKALGPGKRSRSQQTITSDTIVRALRKEQVRQRQALKKAELCERRLAFTVSGLRVLLADEDFVNLLRAEELATLPAYLAEQIKRGGQPSG